MQATKMALGAALLAALLIAGPAAAQEDLKQEMPGASSFPSPEVTAPSLDGFVVMEEEEWTATMADEPQKNLEEALQKLAAGDAEGAAHDLQKAAAHTRSAASRSDGQVKKLLLQTARRLNEEADALEGGAAVPEAELDALFARDLLALAQHHAERAGTLWLARKPTATGRDLRAAALDVGYAQAWASLEPDPRVDTAVLEAREVAALLIAEEPVDPDRALSSIEQIQEVTAALEEGVWPEPSSN
jgi:hypothetical protein